MNFEQQMKLSDVENRIVKDWVLLQSTEEGAAEFDERMQSSVDLDRMMFRDRESFWRMVVAICAGTEDEWVLANVAAGPLESFVSCHGHYAIGQIAEAAKNSEEFRAMLDGIWRNKIDKDVWQELQKIRGT